MLLFSSLLCVTLNNKSTCRANPRALCSFLIVQSMSAFQILDSLQLGNGEQGSCGGCLLVLSGMWLWSKLGFNILKQLKEEALLFGAGHDELARGSLYMLVLCHLRKMLTWLRCYSASEEKGSCIVHRPVENKPSPCLERGPASDHVAKGTYEEQRHFGTAETTSSREEWAASRAVCQLHCRSHLDISD